MLAVTASFLGLICAMKTIRMEYFLLILSVRKLDLD